MKNALEVQRASEFHSNMRRYWWDGTNLLCASMSVAVNSRSGVRSVGIDRLTRSPRSRTKTRPGESSNEDQQAAMPESELDALDRQTETVEQQVGLLKRYKVASGFFYHSLIDSVDAISYQLCQSIVQRTRRRANDQWVTAVPRRWCVQETWE